MQQDVQPSSLGDGWSGGSPEQLCLEHLYKSQPVLPAVLCQQPAAGFKGIIYRAEVQHVGLLQKEKLNVGFLFLLLLLENVGCSGGSWSWEDTVPAHGQDLQPAHAGEPERLGPAFGGRCWGSALTGTWLGRHAGDEVPSGRTNCWEPTAPHSERFMVKKGMLIPGISRRATGRWSSTSIPHNEAFLGRRKLVPFFLKTQGSCWLHPLP